MAGDELWPGHKVPAQEPARSSVEAATKVSNRVRPSGRGFVKGRPRFGGWGGSLPRSDFPFGFAVDESPQSSQSDDAFDEYSSGEWGLGPGSGASGEVCTSNETGGAVLWIQGVTISIHVVKRSGQIPDKRNVFSEVFKQLGQTEEVCFSKKTVQRFETPKTHFFR